MLARVGTFTRPTTAAPFDQSITGLGFRPKGIIFLYMPSGADGFRTSFLHSLGWCSGPTQQYAHAHSAADNVTTTDTKSAFHDAVILTVASGGGILAEADLLRFDDDGFTVRWVTSDANPDRVIVYLAVGGNDVQVDVGAVRAPSAAGTQDFTTGFQPDGVLLFMGLDTVVAQANIARMRFGAAISSTAQWAIASTARRGQTVADAVDAVRTQRTDRVLVGLNETGTALEAEAEFVGMMANGFRLNWITAPPADPVNRPYVSWFAIRGANAAVGVVPKSTGGAPASQDIPLGFAPRAVLLASWGLTAATGIQADAEYSVGAFDGTTEGSNWIEAQDNVLPTEVNAHRSTTKCLVLANGPSTVTAEADGALLDNGFRLTWTTNSAVAAEIAYVAFGDVRTLAYPVPGAQPVMVPVLQW